MVTVKTKTIIFTIVFFLVMCLATGSCVKRAASVKKDDAPKADKSEEKQENKQPENALVKPTLDEDKPKPEKQETQAAKSAEEIKPQATKATRGPAKTPKTKTRKEAESEDSEEPQIIEVMKDLAKTVGGVTLAKLCYSKNDDEYWILFYRESGGKVDLKQFIWNRHSEIPEPFLVIREFSRGRMNIEMKKNEEGKECKVIKLDEEKQK